MADSLIDFGNIAQLAQGNLRNAMQMHQMGIQEQQLGLQQRRTDVDEQQLAVNQQSATLNQIKTLHEVYKDPRYQFNPTVRNHLMSTVLKLAGAPDSGINTITSRNEEMDKLMKGLASTDPAEIQKAYAGLTITMTPEQFAEFRKKTEDADKLHQQNESIAQLRKMNEAQFQKIQDNTARVNIGRPLAMVASVEFGRLLQGTDTKEFGEVLKAAQGKPDLAAALMSSADKFGQGVKRKIPQILDGRMASKTKEFSDLAERHKEDASIAEDTLKQWEEKQVPLPKGVSPAMLKAKIEMSTIAADAYRAMSEWTMTPFDEGKYRAARNGAKNIEAFRQELDVLDKKTQRESAQLKNAAMALANEKFDMSHQEKLASDYAQRVFKENLAAGMDENRAAVAAGKAVTEQFPDTPYDADKLKTSKPLVDLRLNTSQTASEEAAKDFMKETRATYNQLKQAPALLTNIEKAKQLIPSAKAFMGPGGEGLLQVAKFFNNRLGANIDTKGIKDAETLRTRIFMNVMDSLKKLDAQPSQQQQERLEKALGSLETDPNAVPEILDAFGDVLREKIDLHNEEVAGAKKRGVSFPYDPTINAPKKAERGPSQPGKAEPSSPTPIAPFKDQGKEDRYQKWLKEHPEFQ